MQYRLNRNQNGKTKRDKNCNELNQLEYARQEQARKEETLTEQARNGIRATGTSSKRS